MRWSDYKNGLYNYYCKHTEHPISREAFDKEVVDDKDRDDKYMAYFGYSRKDTEHQKVVYVGTTIQHPMSRWYYHSIHGKNLDFVEAYRFDNEKDMLDKEWEEIKARKPSMNKIKNRPQNFNVPLTPEVLKSRKGNPEWCQCCLTRRVSKGYKYCYYCSKV